MTTSAFPHPEDFLVVLENCLERLFDEEQSLDSVLLLYPRLRNQLRPLLEAAVWLNNKKFILNPRPDFLPTSRNNLVEHLRKWDRTYQVARRTRGRKTRLVIWKNAVFFSLIGPFFTDWLSQ